MERKILTGLNPSEYEHPFDKKALASLEATPGLPSLLKTIKKYSFDKVQKVIHTGSCLQVGENQYPKVYDIFKECCEVLDVRKPPRLYLMQMYELNAYATCFTDPLIVLGTGCLEVLTDDELRFIIGHELGHIKSQHLLYHDLATIIAQIGTIIGHLTLGIGDILTFALEVALLYWYRMSEFTSDRAGMLACQSYYAAMSTTAKMAGVTRNDLSALNVEEFMLQARRFISYDLDALDKLAKYYALVDQKMTHPWTVMRAHELDKWVSSGQYDAVLRRNELLAENSFVKCPKCGEPMRPGDRFCGRYGYKKED